MIKFSFKQMAVIVPFFIIGTVYSSCSTGYGCALEERYNNPDLNSGKKGKSTIFSQSQKKKMHIKP